jgi:hypothetical protein
MPRGARAIAVLLVAGFAPIVSAQPLAPDGPPPVRESADQLPPAADEPARSSSRPNHPPPILGAPIAAPGTSMRPPADSEAVPAGFTETPKAESRGRAVRLGAPRTDADAAPPMTVVPAGKAESVAERSSHTGPIADPVNDLLKRRTKRDDLPRTSNVLGEKLDGWFGPRNWFQSDHAFDNFISPVTNPFLFEDPRSLTEVRPIFMYQRVPGRQPDFDGGNITFFGTQARLAVTDRLSFVLHKLGGIWLNPQSNYPFDNQAGFAEIWLGPKYTFIRNEETGSVWAGGLQFQIPAGTGRTFQDTGSLSLVPYVSYGQNLFRDFSWGSFNVMATTGYSFSTDNKRSDYYYLSGHIDWDVMNAHKFYPLFELNYLVNTTDGKTVPLGSEGRDLINFGAQAKGRGLLTGAFGARYKITESAQIGAAFEMPFAGPKDFFQYRFTVDFIWRY